MRALCVVLLTTLVATCGQKGPLVLPDPTLMSSHQPVARHASL